jgi:hypothetical protein
LKQNVILSNPSANFNDLGKKNRRIAKSKTRLKLRNSLVNASSKNRAYNFVVNLGNPAHPVKKIDLAILLQKKTELSNQKYDFQDRIFRIIRIVQKQTCFSFKIN